MQVLTDDGIRAVFRDLVEQPRWVAWKHEGSRKRPVNPLTGRYANVSDEATWGTLEQALERCDRDGLNGVGIVLGGGLGGIDLDGCRDPDTGELTPWARRIVDAFASYTEISPSGTGLKIFAFGAPDSLPANKIPMDTPAIHSNGRRKEAQVEPYVGQRGRYFTVTALPFEDAPTEIRDASDAWEGLVRELEQHGGDGAGGTEAGEATSAHEYKPSGTDVLPARFVDVLREDDGLRRLWRDGESEGDDTRSGLDASLVARMTRAGFSDAEIEGALRQFDHGQVASGDLSEDEADRQVRRLIGKARTRWQVEERSGPGLNPEVWAAGDLMQADLPEVEWAAEGFIPLGDLGVISALFDTGKTWTEIQVALDMALGRPVFDHFNVPEPLRSLIVMGEGTPAGTRSRLLTLARAIGAGPEDIEDRIHVVHGLDARLGDPDLDRLLRKLIREHSADVLWLDPLSEFLEGSEGNDEDIKEALHPLRSIRDDMGTTVQVVHHARQPSDEDFGKPAGVLWRGRTNIADWADVGYTMEGTGRQDINVRRAKSRNAVVEEEFVLRWEEGETEDGSTLRLVHEEQSDVMSYGQDLEPTIERAMEELRRLMPKCGPDSWSFWTNNSSRDGGPSGRSETLERAIEELVEIGEWYVDEDMRFKTNQKTVMTYPRAVREGLVPPASQRNMLGGPGGPR